MTLPALQLKMTSDPAEIAHVRKAIEAFAQSAGFGEGDVYNLGLCVNEAIANIIRHAYLNQRGRPIELSAELAGEKLIVTLRDWGNGKMPDVKKAEPPDPACEISWKPGGLGLPCLKRLLDELQFQPQSDGMRLTMCKIKR